MQIQALPQQRKYDVAVAGAVEEVTVSRLSLAQLRERAGLIEDKVRAAQRREFVAAAQLLQPEQRQQFLVEACKANTVTEKALNEVSDTVWCLSMTLAMATKLPESEITRLFEAAPDIVAGMYLYSLGADAEAASAEEAGPKALGFPEPSRD